MGREYGHDWRQELASALEWWRDAGLETLTDDAPRDWLARPAPVRESAAEVPAVAAAAAEPLPETLEAFVAWRLGDRAPEAEWLTPRVPPSGAAGAGLMILTDMPEADDREHLMDGAEGRLLDAILAAIGEQRESVYLASLAVARPLTGRIAEEDVAGLAMLAWHHIALVGPQRLLLLGQTVDRVRDTTNGSGFGNYESAINHFVRNKGAVVIDHPRLLLGRPGRKAEAWNQLMHLRRGTSL